MQQGPSSGPTNFRCHRRKFSRPDDLVLCTLWYKPLTAMLNELCELLCVVRFPEPVELCRYMDLVTDRTPEERLPNSDRNKKLSLLQSEQNRSGTVPTHP